MISGGYLSLPQPLPEGGEFSDRHYFTCIMEMALADGASMPLYDAIVVTAGAPDAPQSLKNQLAIGGRLVIPTGPARAQELVRIRRTGEDEYDQEEHSFMDWIWGDENRHKIGLKNPLSFVPLHSP